MSDLTVYAETLIATITRAFYDDDAICLIDILLRDKYLRDDDMASRLSLPAKKLRSILQFLKEEHLVKIELVNDLIELGSQATKFWYIDYNHAVHSIRLRLHILQKQFEQAELNARCTNSYVCPGYEQHRCNGQYTEEEAQQIIDDPTSGRSGLFLCQECFLNYEADPNPPDVETYTLRLVDNTKELQLATDTLRRFKVQLSGKTIEQQFLRRGIFELVKKCRGKGKDPITSNLPSDNIALGIGTQRWPNTGRTHRRLLEQQGGRTDDDSHVDFGGGGGHNNNGAQQSIEGGNGSSEEELTYLKNAMGHDIAFSVEKGSGARANLLATQTRGRRRKLMDAVAARVGISIPIEDQIIEEEQHNKKRTKTNNDNGDDKASSGPSTTASSLSFLENNIGQIMMENRKEEEEMERLEESENDNNNNDDDHDDDETHHGRNGEILFLEEDEMIADEMPLHLLGKTKTTRCKATFQLQYSKEMDRQAQLLQLEPADASTTPMVSLMIPPSRPPPTLSWRRRSTSAASAAASIETTGADTDGDDDPSILWKDGEVESSGTKNNNNQKK